MTSRKSKGIRKGQSTMEYLYAHGWMILVIIIGLLILWQMGVFKIPVFTRGYLGFSEVLPTDWGVYHTNEVYLRLVNHASIGVIIPTGGVYLTIGTVNCSIMSSPPTPFSLGPGDENSRLVVMDCSTPPTLSSTYSIGDYYEADIVITYNNTKTGKLHKSVGKIFGPVEGPFTEITTTTTTTTITITTTTIGYIAVNESLPSNGSSLA